MFQFMALNKLQHVFTRLSFARTRIGATSVQWQTPRSISQFAMADFLDMIIFGEEPDVAQIESDLLKAFVAKSEGVMKEYVGNKIDLMCDSETGLGVAKFTQPVLIQKLRDMLGEDETSKRVPTTPAKPGEVIHKGDGLNPIKSSDASYFRSMTALTMYMMQWSLPEISNTSRSCARVMSNPKV
jgi:hypothetical protein